MPNDNTVVLENVDTKLLENQRKVLIEILCNTKKTKELTPVDLEALEGLQGMLDDWSDTEFFKKIGNIGT